MLRANRKTLLLMLFIFPEDFPASSSRSRGIVDDFGRLDTTTGNECSKNVAMAIGTEICTEKKSEANVMQIVNHVPRNMFFPHNVPRKCCQLIHIFYETVNTIDTMFRKRREPN